MPAHTVTGGGGLKLHVQETGNPRGKAILFIHGFSQCHLAWNKQLHSDLADDFRLVAMDIRGHGLSEKPRDAYGDSRLWAEDVQAVITTLGLDRPVLSGWSYGGAIISDYVNVYGEDYIAATNWVGAVSRLGNPLRQEGFAGTEFMALAPGFFTENVEDSIDTLQKFLRLCVHNELTPEDFYCFLGFNAIVPPYVRLGLFSRHLNNDPVLAGMRKPMLLSYGAQDAIVLLSMGQHIARLAPHAHLSVYDQVGHAPFLEAPERFNRELRALRDAA